jgi:inosose dehydratase
MIDKSRITAAIWTWGTETREQMELAAREVTAIGYKSFESVKSAIHAYDMDLASYKEVLNRYDLKPASFYFHLPVKGAEETDVFPTLEKELDFVSRLDVKLVTLQATYYHPESPLSQTDMEYELALITRFAKIAATFGLTTNLHPHHNTWVMHENEIDYMLQNSDPKLVSFAPDTAHMIAGGCDPVKMVKKYAERVHFTHLKDIKSANITSEGLAPAGMEVYSDFCELGTGIVDFKSIFEILKGVNYTGPLCEELDIAPVSNAESAKNNYDFLVNNY